MFVPNKQTEKFIDKDKGFYIIVSLSLVIALSLCTLFSFLNHIAGVVYLMSHTLGYVTVTMESHKFKNTLNKITGILLHPFAISFVLVIVYGKFFYEPDIDVEDPKEFFFNQKINL